MLSLDQIYNSLQKFSLLKLLSSKMQNQLIKTKQRYRELEFNKIVFNENYTNIYNIVNQFKNFGEMYDEDSIANSYAYLILFMCMIGHILGARMWLNFQFKNHKSIIRLDNETIANLHPKEPRINNVLQQIKVQLYQLTSDTLDLKIEKLSDFFQVKILQLKNELRIISTFKLS